MTIVFGNPAEFAIEAAVESDPRYPPIQHGHLAGRLRVWVDGKPIGRLEEPSCWLEPPLSHLQSLVKELDQLWLPEFETLAPVEIFNLLNLYRFGCNSNGELLEDDSIDFDRLPTERFVFLLHASEAFDGWKSFMIRWTPNTLLVVSEFGENRHRLEARFSVSAFLAATQSFEEWLSTTRHKLSKGAPPP